MILPALLLAARAFCQDPAQDTDEGAPVGEEGVYEITVYGEPALREAREAIKEDMRRMGWKAHTKRNGETVFRPPKTWMGRMHFDREGLLWFGRPVVAVRRASASGAEGAWTEDAGLKDLPENRFVPQISFYVLPSKSRLVAVHERVLGEVGPEVAAYQDVLRRTAFREALFALPARLDALWTDGTPLEGDGASLESYEARRAAVLAHWATRAPTPEGDEVSRAIEVWLAEVVQPSDHPVTAEERAAAEALRSDGRKLELVRTPEPGSGGE